MKMRRELVAIAIAAGLWSSVAVAQNMTWAPSGVRPLAGKPVDSPMNVVTKPHGRGGDWQ